MRNIFILLFALFLNLKLLAIYTTNGGSSNFTSGSAWTGGSAPNMTFWDGSHDANVSHDLTYTGNLTISSGNILTIKNGATLTITGTLDIGYNGSVVIESGGRIDVNIVDYSSAPSSITNSGILNVTTYFTIDVDGTFTSSGTFITGGNLTMTSSGDVDLSGNSTIGGNISSSGSGTDFDLNGGTLTVAGDVTFNSDGNATIDGDMDVTGDMNVIGSGGASVDGTLDIDGNLDIDNNGDINGYGIVGWNTASINANCSPALLTCSGTGTSLDNNTVGWCAGTYASPPSNRVDLNTCTSASPLPVELIEFDVKNEEEIIQVKWVTATEINNNYFEIQVSNDGGDWEVIRIVQGMGNTFNITEYFEIIQTHKRYIRLKQVDYDGTSTYSNVKLIYSNQPLLNITPTHIIVSNFIDGDISLYTIKGELVYDVENGGEIILINKSQFSQGLYLLRVGGITKKIYIHGN